MITYWEHSRWARLFYANNAIEKSCLAYVYAGPKGHTARSLRTRLPEFENTLSAIWTHPVPVKQVSASGTGCCC